MPTCRGMESPPMTSSPPKFMLTTRDVGDRYGGKHPRTIKRWWTAGVIPPPDLTINNRHYWKAAALDQRDRERVVEFAGGKIQNAAAT
jgi:hypothetical protein